MKLAPALSRLVVPCALALLLGCQPAAEKTSSQPPDPATPGSGASGGKSGSGGAPAGNGSGGAGGAGTGSGGSSGGQGGQGGDVGSGSGPGGAAGGSAGAGSGGAAGVPDAGPAETGAPATDAGGGGGVAIADRLHRYIRTLKCVRDNPQDTRRSCFCSDPDANKHDVITFKGDPAVTYDVVIHVRGIVEPRGYTGGALQDPANPWFYVGGMPGGPDDNALYNQYKLLVSAPMQVYYLNKNHDNFLKSSRDHDLHKLDYKVTIKVKGGATVDVANEDRPSGMNRNHMKLIVDGVPADLVMQGPNGFDGQFFYLEIVSVTPAT